MIFCAATTNLVFLQPLRSRPRTSTSIRSTEKALPTFIVLQTVSRTVLLGLDSIVRWELIRRGCDYAKQNGKRGIAGEREEDGWDDCENS